MKKLMLTALALSLGFSVSAQKLRTLNLVDPEYREAAKNATLPELAQPRH